MRFQSTRLGPELRIDEALERRITGMTGVAKAGTGKKKGKALHMRRAG